MRQEVDDGSENGFYKFTAAQLPVFAGCEVLDLGCGTGIELEEYFMINPGAVITGIDLSKAMLGALAKKSLFKSMRLVCGSYFDIPLGIEKYDVAVSVESLHHYTEKEKLSLYRNLFRALKDGGYFILTDYFAESAALEKEYFENLAYLKKQQNITDHAFYHYDTPLLPEHEMEVLKNAGFSNVAVLKRWGATCTLKAIR
ncbi:MAG: class I SAM-dependent methyltransferase [Lachnospiraceae bacterium]|nr:class I SAM-dependent methyltransferase [Lachnospiraceae bacterium]